MDSTRLEILKNGNLIPLKLNENEAKATNYHCATTLYLIELVKLIQGKFQDLIHSQSRGFIKTFKR